MPPTLFELWNTDLSPYELNLPIMRSLELEELPRPMSPICQFESGEPVEEVVWALEGQGLFISEVWEGTMQYTLWLGRQDPGIMGTHDDVEVGEPGNA